MRAKICFLTVVVSLVSLLALLFTTPVFSTEDMCDSAMPGCGLRCHGDSLVFKCGREGTPKDQLPCAANCHVNRTISLNTDSLFK